MASSNRQFGIQTTGVERNAKRLAAIGGRGADARPAWPLVFQQMRADSEERFKSEGEGTWPKLADITKETKARKGLDPRIMHASNALYRSLTAERGRNTIRRKAKTQLRFGTKLFYADFHQRGRGVPKRPVLQLSERTQEEITRTLSDYVAVGQLRKKR
jgi:phage gpG-like protein